jgi:hypothetical protein
MNNKQIRRILIITAAIGFVVLLLNTYVGVAEISAQEQSGWSHPFQISTAGRTASRGFPVSDAYGYVHLLWYEVNPDDDRTVIQYSRYDGTSWSVPIDLHITLPNIPIVSLSPYIDEDQNLHLLWSQGFTGMTQVYYMEVPAFYADQFENWSKPIRARLVPNDVRLIVGKDGTLHLLYTKITGPDAGVYYTDSTDNGLSWSDSEWLDPDIPPFNIPNSLEFKMDGSGGLHGSWFYADTAEGGGNWVRYSHSLDGSRDWSAPITIAQIPEDDDINTLDAAGPVMAVSGDTIHLIYTGGTFHFRNHTYSTDQGNTWTDPLRIFGDLQGQAFESLITDDIGRIHYFGQIRYPTGIYHAVWENGGWSPTELLYLIKSDSGDLIGDRIHAHHVYPAIRDGDQVVITFADPPPTDGRRLFSMTGVLAGADHQTPIPPPTPVATPTVVAPTAPAAGITSTAPPFDREISASEQAGPPRGIITAGLLSPIVLLVLAIIIRMLQVRSSR